MMTSTITSSRSDDCLRYGAKDIQYKKESLLSLETALKEKTNELRLLCLKEAELTGQLPIDYPLQPREPIPQVRRRVVRKLVDRNCIVPPPRHNRGLSAPHKAELMQPNQRHYFVMPTTHMNLPFPARPTSTNSTSSSNSTASSHTRSTSIGISTNQTASASGSSLTSSLLSSSSSTSSTSSNGQSYVAGSNHQQRPSTKFQPFVEETKPFQMSDYYKYSTKHRQKTIENELAPPKFKTTRQLQEEVQKKNLLNFASCDEQLQNSRKLIEKSGQKLIEVTAKAIAGNPGIAEKLNNVLPNYGDRY